MLAVISPAKTLDFESQCPALSPSQPDFLEEAEAFLAIGGRHDLERTIAQRGADDPLCELLVLDDEDGGRTHG